jgi:hypothetical protein
MITLPRLRAAPGGPQHPRETGEPAPRRRTASVHTPPDFLEPAAGSAAADSWPSFPRGRTAAWITRRMADAAASICAAAVLLFTQPFTGVAQGGACPAVVSQVPASVRPTLEARRARDRAARKSARPLACAADFAPPRVRFVSDVGRGTSPSVTVRFAADDEAGLDPSASVTLDGNELPVSAEVTGPARTTYSATVRLTPDRPHLLVASVWDAAGNRTVRRALLSYDASGRMPVVRAGSFGSETLNSSMGVGPATEAKGGSAGASIPDGRPHRSPASVSHAAGSRMLRRSLASLDAFRRVLPLSRAGSLGSAAVDRNTGVGAATETSASSAAPPAPDLLPNAGTTLERSLCLTISAGAGAASECGDLRLVHPLPGMKTYNQQRTPVLLYNSQHAHPHPLVTAQVTVPAGSGTPSQVTATLTVGGVLRQTRSWAGSQFPPGVEQQVVMDFDGLEFLTAVYGYVLEVTSWYGGVAYPSQVQGEMVVVNRSNSSFGAGWWLAGWERLYILDNYTRLLRVGGDGSTRVYTIAGSWGTWRAPALDRPDTVTYGTTDGYTGYIRKLPGGAKVLYTGAGGHQHTVDRLGRRTTFLMDGNTLALNVLMLPSPTRSWTYDYSYLFTYGGTGGRISAVTQYAGSSVRTVQVACCNSLGQITGITDPDAQTTYFGTYANGVPTRFVTELQRPGLASVAYTYDAGQKLRVVRSAMQGTAPDIVTTLVPQETRGMGGPPLPMDSVYTLLDGPRTDVVDVTRFWVDRWGHPWKTQDALGHIALAWRADARFPGLVTQTQAANGLVSRAWYDVRGNVDSTRVENPLGDGRNAVTRYRYGNAAWPDFVTRIIRPAGDSTVMDYDTAGNRR